MPAGLRGFCLRIRLGIDVRRAIFAVDHLELVRVTLEESEADKHYTDDDQRPTEI